MMRMLQVMVIIVIMGSLLVLPRLPEAKLSRTYGSNQLRTFLTHGICLMGSVGYDSLKHPSNK